MSTLDLSNSNLETYDLTELIKYKNVDLSHNKLNNVILDNTNFDNLHLNNNKLHILFIKNLICEYLDLSNNNLRNIIFIDCVIENINLKSNIIENIEFVNTPVTKIDLSYNNLEELKFSSLPSYVEEVKLNNNKLSTYNYFSDSISWLDISNNKIIEINNLSKNLLHLNISSNFLTKFNFKLLSSSLKYFDIRNNNISNITDIDLLKIPEKYFDEQKSILSSSPESEISIKLISKKYIDSDDVDKILSSDDNLSSLGDKDINSENSFSDDEIAQALKEYKMQSEKAPADNEFVDLNFKPIQNSKFKSHYLYDFENEVSESSEENTNPTYVNYDLFWQINL